jgi:hypothetical protein
MSKNNTEHGAVLADGVQIASTLQCCHCNKHFISRPGSGARRAFCMKCMQVTCGDPRCDECTPFAKKLDLYEAGKLTEL